MKSFLRCGMGPCQGRLCGLTVTELIAAERGVPPERVGYYRLRPPVKPIPLAELANLPQDEAATRGRGPAMTARPMSSSSAAASTAVPPRSIWRCAASRPIVIEKDYAGRHASGVNAGGVRQLARHLAEVPLSVASMEIWERIRDVVDDDCGFEAHGQVLIAESEAELDGFRARVDELRLRGYTHEELIDRAELKRLVPAVADHCPGGVVSRRDGAADPFRTTQAIRRKSIALGARVIEGVDRRQAWRATAARGGLRQVTATSRHPRSSMPQAPGPTGSRPSSASRCRSR